MIRLPSILIALSTIICAIFGSAAPYAGGLQVRAHRKCVFIPYILAFNLIFLCCREYVLTLL